MAEPRADFIAHCDWSTQTDKRWMAIAERQGSRWEVRVPEAVGDAAALLDRLSAQVRRGPVVVGFDFPIGVPAVYGEMTGLLDFREALQQFGNGIWRQWYDVAENRSEISLQRPFYPFRPGGALKVHLTDALGISNSGMLLRACEQSTKHRQAACMLFWTLGGNQVGKAAISGWKTVLAPNIGRIGIWPFDGKLDALLSSKSVVVTETYPGDVYGQIGIPRYPKWSKRRQIGRISVSKYLLDWIAAREALASSTLARLIEHGFSDGKDGEDQFDSLVGLFGMIDVVDGRRPEGTPDTPEVLKWEGWILGQASA